MLTLVRPPLFVCIMYRVIAAFPPRGSSCLGLSEEPFLLQIHGFTPCNAHLFTNAAVKTAPARPFHSVTAVIVPAHLYYYLKAGFK
ncbi:hypothetical protein, partial [Eisenbergiella porci]|uniref:hypothetical protein n=1 Tax=Eisenbergiella porci TaxID=2652274 RepID=UPI003AB6C0A6